MAPSDSVKQRRPASTIAVDDDLVIVSRRGNDLVLLAFVEGLIAAMRAQGLTSEEIRRILDAAQAATPNNPLNPLSPERVISRSITYLTTD